MYITEKYYNKKFLIITGFIMIIVFLALRTFDAPLHTNPAPGGILSFEFAKSIDKAEVILESWDSKAKINAGFSLGLDYLFLFVYSLFFSISIYLLTNIFVLRFSILRKVGLVLSILVLFAGLFDAIENYALIKLLLGSDNKIFPLIAYYFASVKFIIIVLGLFYIFIGLLFRLFIKMENRI